MDKKDIHLGDWNRILFGEAPPIFLLEVLIRTLVTYLVLLVVTRFLGKRMSGQLTITEMAVMLTLGAIVAVSMQVPESGMFMAIIVLMCTLTFERGLSFLEFKHNKLERFTQGDLSILIKDGVIQYKEMLAVRITNQQLYAALRNEGIYNLGMIKRVYMEASGIFSIFQADKEKPGLPIFPPDDPGMIKQEHLVNLIACVNCGFVKDLDNHDKCSDCGHEEWTKAILSKTKTA